MARLARMANVVPPFRAIGSCAGCGIAGCLADSCGAAGVLDPQGPIAAAQRLILVNATAIMLVVVVPVIVLTLAFAWWDPPSNKRALYSADLEISGHIEQACWPLTS